MESNILNLRFTLSFALLVILGFTFLSFARAYEENDEIKVQLSSDPSVYHPFPYNNPILKAWGDGGAEDLEPGGGTDNGGGYVDPAEEVSIKDSAWGMTVLVFIYAIYKYWASKKRKHFNFFKTNKINIITKTL